MKKIKVQSDTVVINNYKKSTQDYIKRVENLAQIIMDKKNAMTEKQKKSALKKLVLVRKQMEKFIKEGYLCLS